jgi:hypothetical protein
MSPARAAVLRNVLVSEVSKIVSVVNIIPNPLVREAHGFKRLLDNRSDWLGALPATGFSTITESG